MYRLYTTSLYFLLGVLKELYCPLGKQLRAALLVISDCRLDVWVGRLVMDSKWAQVKVAKLTAVEGMTFYTRNVFSLKMEIPAPLLKDLLDQVWGCIVCVQSILYLQDSKNTEL